MNGYVSSQDNFGTVCRELLCTDLCLCKQSMHCPFYTQVCTHVHALCAK